MSEVHGLESVVDKMIEEEQAFEKVHYPDDQLDATPEGETQETSDDFGSQGEGVGSDNRDQQEAQPGSVSDTAPKAQEQQQPQPQAPSTKEIGWVKADTNGNLVDATGKIVAKAGAERRFYETQVRPALAEANRAQQEHQLLWNKFQDTQSKLSAMETVATAYKQYGLSDDEYTEGLSLLKSWKENPVGVAVQMLTTLQNKGYNVSTLLGQPAGELEGEGVAQTLTPVQVNQMIQQALAAQRVGPSNGAAQPNPQAQQEALMQQAKNEADSFLSNPAFPYARIHEQSIARLLQSDPSLSMEGAYAKLQHWAYQNGLDFAGDLVTQIEAHRNRSAGTKPTAVPPISMGQSLGAGNGTNGGPSALTTDHATSANTDTKDIVRQAMKAAGLSVDNL